MEKEEKKSKKILNFVIKTMNGMAYGLFATLIVGTILATIGGSSLSARLSSPRRKDRGGKARARPADIRDFPRLPISPRCS